MNNLKLDTLLSVYSNKDIYYVQTQKNLSTTDQILLSEAQTLSEDNFKSLSKIFDPKGNNNILQFKSLVLQNILKIDLQKPKNSITWISELRNVRMYFKSELGIKDGKANLPYLIFHRPTNGNTYVFAIKTKTINNRTVLYRAPFHNVSNDGSICFGNAKINMEINFIDDIIQYYEDLFFKSQFTENRVGNATIDLNELWNNIIQTGKRFPNNALIRSTTQLSDII